MAKTNRQITIDSEIDEELSNTKNASGLINDLLKEYFYKSGHLKKQQLIVELGKEQTKLGTTQNRIKNIKELIAKAEAKEKRLNTIPSDIIGDFHAFPKMTEHILRGRYLSIYKERYGVTWEELKKAFEEFKKE